MPRPDITESEFHAYEKVRVSGVTNMYLIQNVQALSGLDRETIRLIQKRYGELKAQYGVPVSIEEAAEELRAEYDAS